MICKMLVAAALAIVATVPAHASSPNCNTAVPTFAGGAVGTTIAGIGLGFITGGVAHKISEDSCRNAEAAEHKSTHPTKRWRNPDTGRYQ